MVFKSDRKWENNLKQHFRGYTLIRHEVLVGMQLSLFVKTEYTRYISDIHSSKIGTGIGNLGNKGSVGICLKFCQSTFLFINSHFAGKFLIIFQAHEGNVLQRNADYSKTMSDISIVCPSDTHNLPLTARFQNVFWLGDLNYRLNAERSLVETLLKEGKVKVIFSYC
jgi:hypothetical protein